MKRWFARRRWWLLRVAALPVHLAVFALVVFFLVRAIPGDPVLTVTGGQIDPSRYEEVRTALGLGGTIWDQLGRYAANLARLDLGSSLLSGRTVLEEFASRLPATLELVTISLVLTLLVSTALGLLVLLRPRNVVSRVVSAYSRTAGGVPDFCLGVLFIFVFYASLQWAPAPLGRLDPGMTAPPAVTGFPLVDALAGGRPDAFVSMLAHLTLPVLVLVVAQSAIFVRLLAAALTDALDSQPTRFMIASGAGRRAVVWSILRRALPPMVTMAGVIYGYMLGGAVVLESLFGLGGIGQYAVDAVNSADLPALQGFLLVIAALTLVVFLVVDLVVMILDPRRRSGRTEVSA
ncbi:ABC transporter permease [Pseudonocardia pini]|uniref:ABC transporter permease n=1 Tax=Pseudonocardia pini TaxID=2758030 RepID=UPI0015F067D8|nr:ABC transporter permease [Pseudonocardia pini]